MKAIDKRTGQEMEGLLRGQKFVTVDESDNGLIVNIFDLDEVTLPLAYDTEINEDLKAVDDTIAEVDERIAHDEALQDDCGHCNGYGAWGDACNNEQREDCHDCTDCDPEECEAFESFIDMAKKAGSEIKRRIPGNPKSSFKSKQKAKKKKKAKKR